ncbi:hypothetical protein BHE74_00023955 [Ensete ventricosum]|nr:hypothetical protein BHE74_00023955 [Ensete ventricosum]
MQATPDDHEPAVAPAGGKAGRCRLALAGWPLATAPCKRVAGSSPLRGAPRVAAPCGLVAPTRGLAVACHPYRWPGRDWPPQQGVWPWSIALVEGRAMAGHPLSSLLSLRKHIKNV